MSDKIEVVKEFLDKISDELKEEFKLDLADDDIEEIIYEGADLMYHCLQVYAHRNYPH